MKSSKTPESSESQQRGVLNWISTYRHYLFSFVIYLVALGAPALSWMVSDGFIEALIYVGAASVVSFLALSVPRNTLEKHPSEDRFLTVSELVFDLFKSIGKGSNREQKEIKEAAYRRGYSRRANFVGTAHEALEEVKQDISDRLERFQNGEFIGEPNILTSDEEAAFVEGFEAAQDDAFSSYQKHGLSCRKCGDVAYPVTGTDRIYACDCGNRFSSVKHPRYF